MRLLAPFIILWLILAPMAAAGEDTALRRLQTSDESRGWEAVGRLDLGGNAFCTGSLIAPDLVLTAAHCLFDSDTGKPYPPGDIEFLAGWRNGHASATSAVIQALYHPEFQFQNKDQKDRVAWDLGLLRLQQPIRKSSITPFEIRERPRKGAQVGVVSYGHSRSKSPSLQEACTVLARRSGVLVLSCDVEFGSSGAPIFVTDEQGKARIVSVISSKAHIGDRTVALGMALEKPLADLMALMAHSEPPPMEAKTGVRIIRLGSTGTGAKFLRP